MIGRAPTTRAHLVAIFANQSDQMKADMAAIRIAEPAVSDDAMLEWFASMLPDPDTETAILDGNPVGAIGWDKWKNTWYSWSATSPAAYDPNCPAFVRLQRRFFKDTAERNPGVTLRMKPVVPVTGRMTRWMGCLGFDFDAAAGHFQYRASGQSGS